MKTVRIVIASNEVDMIAQHARNAKGMLEYKDEVESYITQIPKWI